MGTLGAHEPDQRLQMSEAAHTSVHLGGAREIDISAGVSERATRCNAEILEQRFADEMRRLPARLSNADIGIRLAEVDGQKLRVAVGEMEKRQLASSRRQSIERV